MPTINVRHSLIRKYFHQDYSHEELDDMLFKYGLELDEVVNSNENIGVHESFVSKTDGDVPGQACVEEVVYKIELPANRYDLLSIEGLSRALLVFNRQLEAPKYSLSMVPQKERITVEAETATLRPFVVSAILRNVTLDADSYASFIDLQDKLHQSIGRKRTLVAIGTHDYDKVKGPFKYSAEIPSKIKFQPLGERKEFTAEELMVMYSKNSHLKSYIPILLGKERYPVIRDSQGIVLSLPPIINGDHSKITAETKNIFIEVTATHLGKAIIVLDTIVTLFSQYCKVPFEIVPVEVESPDGSISSFPKLKYREMEVDVESISKRIGVEFDSDEITSFLSRMSISCEKLTQRNILKVIIPPTRHDILHDCDISEDVAIVYGYNNIQHKLPNVNTIAEPFALNKLSDYIRPEIAAAGWTETLNFALCSTDDISTKFRRPNGAEGAVKISNPKTSDFQVARTSLLPGIFKTICSNKDMPLPLQLFELQDVVVKCSSTDVGARNERHLAAAYYNKISGFEIVHGLLDRVMELLAVKWSRDGSGYHVTAHNDPAFLNGRCALIFGPHNVEIGIIGVLHPEAVTAFGLNKPISALEINIEPFL